MSKKKQSSVEWLEKAFYTHARPTGIDYDKWVIKEETLDKLFEQAKAMHREEIKKAWEEGFSFSSPYQSAEIYYNETFGE